jgi:geranylgeranyl diphosphate synthase type I
MVMTSKEALVQQTLTLLRERGKAALEVAKQSVQQEQIGYKPLEEALNYFIEEVFKDVMQPGLLSLYCEAVGGKPTETTWMGAAMVLLVGAADLHDDIIDGSVMKNQKPTLLGKFGKDVTILAGDALLIKGVYLLHEAIEGFSEKKAKAILELIKQAFFNLSSAEAEEASHRGKNDLSAEQFLNIIKRKLAVSEATARIGALLGNGTLDDVETLGTLGRAIGLLNTLRDEFIDVFEPEELANRFEREVLPLPVLNVFRDPTKREEIMILLESRKMTKKKTERIVAIVMNAKETDELRQMMRSEIIKAFAPISNLKDCREAFKLLLKSTLEDLQ